MKSWSNTNDVSNIYLRWIEYTQLTNVREKTSLHYGCTHIANWLEPSMNELKLVILKKIVDGRNQLFDFYQVNRYSIKSVAHV
jgi:hypothetical protein